MTISTKKIPLPATFKEVSVLKCDGCGCENDPSQQGILCVDWTRTVRREADGVGGLRDVFDYDFCPECWPKVQRATKQETDAIKAEKLAALAETTGVA